MSSDHVRPSELDRLLRGDDRPETLEEALTLTDAPSDDPPAGADDVRALWDDLVEQPVPPTPTARGWTPTGLPPTEPEAPPVITPGPLVDPPPATDPDADPAAEADVTATPEAEGFWARRAARREAQDEARSDKLALRRHRVLPRTVIGISLLLVALAVGAAVSGAVLYAYYDWRLTENEDRVGTLARSLEDRLAKANEDIAASQENAVNDIRKAADPLAQILADTKTVGSLTPAMAPSVWFVETRDDGGGPAVGSAFVVASDGSRSLLVTSYALVSASTVEPAPQIRLTNGDDEMIADLYNWQPEKDLALLTVSRPDLEPLPWADDDARAAAVGRQAYAVSGLGGRGASLSPGLVVDQSASGMQHTAVLGTAYRGGPIVTTDGKVLGVASLAYEPLGFDPGDLRFAVPIDQTCERVLSCSGTDPSEGESG